MKPVHLFHTGALAGVCVLASAASVSAGPVTYQSQSRTIRAELTEVRVDEDLEETRFRDEDSAAAPDFGDWDATVTAEIDAASLPPGDSAPGVSEVSQRSSLSDAGITAAGNGRVQTLTQDGSFGFETALDVTFTLDETRDFDLDYELGFGTGTETQEQIRLSRADGGTVVFDEEILFDDFGSDGDTAAIGTRAGQLAPGQYRFQFLYGVAGDIGDRIPYTLSLALTPTDTGPGPNPIPLPPAAWSALATMGAMGALRLRRRLRSPAR